MADTRVQGQAERWVVEEALPGIYGQPFKKTIIRLAWGGSFAFDAISADAKIVVCISTSCCRTASGRPSVSTTKSVRTPSTSSPRPMLNAVSWSSLTPTCSSVSQGISIGAVSRVLEPLNCVTSGFRRGLAEANGVRIRQRVVGLRTRIQSTGPDRPPQWLLPAPARAA